MNLSISAIGREMQLFVSEGDQSLSAEFGIPKQPSRPNQGGVTRVQLFCLVVYLHRIFLAKTTVALLAWNALFDIGGDARSIHAQIWLFSNGELQYPENREAFAHCNDTDIQNRGLSIERVFWARSDPTVQPV